MSSEPETTRIVRAWLEDGVTVLPDRVLDRVLDHVPTTSQRRVRRVPVGPARALVAAAVLVIMVAGAVTFGQRIGDAIGDSVATPTALPLVSVAPGPLESGRYVIDTGFPVRISFAVPDGWSKASQGTDYAVVTSNPDGVAERPPSGVTLGFYTVDNLFAETCGADGAMLDPPVGPTVEDLVAGLNLIAADRESTGYHTSAARPASIDGHNGQRIDLSMLLLLCPFGEAHLWQTPSGAVRTPAGDEELNTLWILDVFDERLVVDATSYPSTSQEDRDALMAVVDSIRIERVDEAR